MQSAYHTHAEGETMRGLIEAVSADPTQTWMSLGSCFDPVQCLQYHSSLTQVLLAKWVSQLHAHKRESARLCADSRLCADMQAYLRKYSLLSKELVHFDPRTANHSPTQPLR